jgi:hypothetical protein
VGAGVVAVLAADVSQRSQVVDLGRGLAGGHLSGRGEALFISAVEGRKLANRCAVSRVVSGEVAAEDFSTLDVNVGEGAGLTVVADNTSVRHGCVGESVEVVVVVVSEWVEHLIWLCVMV